MGSTACGDALPTLARVGIALRRIALAALVGVGCAGSGTTGPGDPDLPEGDGEPTCTGWLCEDAVCTARATWSCDDARLFALQAHCEDACANGPCARSNPNGYCNDPEQVCIQGACATISGSNDCAGFVCGLDGICAPVLGLNCDVSITECAATCIGSVCSPDTIDGWCPPGQFCNNGVCEPQ